MQPGWSRGWNAMYRGCRLCLTTVAGTRLATSVVVTVIGLLAQEVRADGSMGEMIAGWRNQATAMSNALRGLTTSANPVIARAESPECQRYWSLAKMPCTLPWRLFSWSPLFWCSTTTVTTF